MKFSSTSESGGILKEEKQGQGKGGGGWYTVRSVMRSAVYDQFRHRRATQSGSLPRISHSRTYETTTSGIKMVSRVPGPRL